MRVAVIPAGGIGDALLMMIASERLRVEGHAVTTFHPKLPELGAWFQTHHFEQEIQDLDRFDMIILQNDNTPKAKDIIHNYRHHKLSVFYPTFEPHKHGKPTSLDQIFDKRLPMAENISRAIGNLLHVTPSKDNGITPPEELTYNKHPKRILIHPTAGEEKKIWPLPHFLSVADSLKTQGFEPVFILSPAEQERFNLPYPAPHFEHLGELAAYVYESGGVIGNDSSVSHLASNLNLPTVVVSDCAKRMKLWRPGWLNGEVVTPPLWIPNFKGSRIREKHWRFFTPPSKVLKCFGRLSKLAL